MMLMMMMTTTLPRRLRIVGFLCWWLLPLPKQQNLGGGNGILAFSPTTKGLRQNHYHHQHHHHQQQQQQRQLLPQSISNNCHRCYSYRQHRPWPTTAIISTSSKPTTTTTIQHPMILSMTMPTTPTTITTTTAAAAAAATRATSGAELQASNILTTPPTVEHFKTHNRDEKGNNNDSHDDDNSNHDSNTRPWKYDNDLDLESYVILILTPSLAVVNYMTYPWVAQTFRAVVDAVSQNSFAPVDGGKLQSDLLLPVLNGPLLGACSILFATLTAMTIATLYNRQVDLRVALFHETEELRQLALAIASLPTTTSSSLSIQREATGYLQRHVEEFLNYKALMAIAERGQSAFHDSRVIRQVGMDPLTILLNRALYNSNDDDADNEAENEDNDDEENTVHSLAIQQQKQGRKQIPDALIGQMYNSIHQINAYRVQAMTALRTNLPVVHYAILVGLACVLSFIFLLETSSRDVLMFLADFQVRFIWAMLQAVFTLIGCVIYDLSTPFTGSYVIFTSSQEGPKEETIRDYVLGPIEEATRTAAAAAAAAATTKNGRRQLSKKSDPL